MEFVQGGIYRLQGHLLLFPFGLNLKILRGRVEWCPVPKRNGPMGQNSETGFDPARFYLHNEVVDSKGEQLNKDGTQLVKTAGKLTHHHLSTDSPWICHDLSAFPISSNPCDMIQDIQEFA